MFCFSIFYMENDEELEEDENDTGEQPKNSRTAHLAPFQYKKGQSGNPKGRPEGISLKEYARLKFRTMTDDEREEFFNGINKIDLFKMAEGNPDTKSDITTGGMPIIQISEAIVNKNATPPPSPEQNS